MNVFANNEKRKGAYITLIWLKLKWSSTGINLNL